MIKAVIFDAGETLIYRNPPLGAIIHRAVLNAGLKHDRAAVERAVVKAADSMKKAVEEGRLSDSEKWEIYMKHVLARLKAGKFDPSELTKKLKAGTSFRRYSDSVRVLRSIRAKGYRTGIISNAPRGLRGMLERAGLIKYFDFVIISEEQGCEKPGRKIFAAALKAARVKPGEAIYVGDNYIADIKGALAAGIRPVWIRRATKNAHFSFHDEAGKEASKVMVIRKLSDLLKII